MGPSGKEVTQEDGTVRSRLIGTHGLAAGKVDGAGKQQRLTTSISVLEWPMLHTMQLFFIRSKCSLVTTFLFPIEKEEDANMSPDNCNLCLPIPLSMAGAEDFCPKARRKVQSLPEHDWLVYWSACTFC